MMEKLCGCWKNMEVYFCHAEKLIQQIEDGLLFKDALDHPSGYHAFMQLHDKLHELIIKVEQMKIILEQDQKDLQKQQNQMQQIMVKICEYWLMRSKKSLSSLKLLETRIDSMLVFSVQNSSSNDISASSSAAVTEETSDNDKENKAVPKRPQSVRKTGVPSLNPLSEKTFISIPKYTKSHLTLVQVNAGINEINNILCKKYELFNKPRKQLSLKEDRKRAMYLDQAKDMKGTNYTVFFCDDDIQQFGSTLKLKRKTKDNIFLILRHLGRMKEIHKSKLTRYCIITA